jgi:hypothetical protein
VARKLLLGLVLVLVCERTAAVQTGGCGSIAETSPISQLGAFSNMRYTAEHAYGFTLMLWRAGDCPIGLLLSSEGLAGDTPIGWLENVAFDTRTGRLSFAAKLTMGAIVGKSMTDLTPTRDLYVFEGQIKGDAISGVMTHTLQNSPAVAPRRTEVVLRASTSDTESMRGSATYGEWRRRWGPILKIRGPKWTTPG